MIAAALDEICAWTAVLVADTLAVTATLDLRLRRPAEPSGALTLTGRLDSRSGRRLRLSGSLAREGTAVAEGSGLFVATDSVASLWSGD